MLIRCFTVLWCPLLSFAVTLASAASAEIDSDSDGLSDFHETHKYFTDPLTSDSDGDGIPDSDWRERREYAYTIRSVVKVLRPCDPAVVTDDYQDGCVLAETDDYLELEVIHYPLNANADAIEGSMDWRSPPANLQEYLQPGVTANWDDAMQRDLLAALQQDGIQVDHLTDKQVIEQVAPWLLARGRYRYMFGTFFLHFPAGKPEILPGLEEAFRRERGNTDLPFAEHLQHEVFGKGMYYNKCYGTCTSTAVYLTTALRALGIPTRMILTIPPVDSSDPRQVQMLESGIASDRIRGALLSGLPSAGFSSHTFNEVYVGGRWRRLNYSKLGQNIYGPGAMGMLTHVHTFADLSEAGLTETWGWRYGRGERDEVFRGSNPYRTMEISDQLGVHAQIDKSVFESPKVAVIEKAYWFFSDERPDWIAAESVEPQPDGHLLAHVDLSVEELRAIYSRMDKRFVLTAKGRPTVRAWAERGHWNSECYLRIPAVEFNKMAPDVVYQLAPSRPGAEYGWRIQGDVSVVKKLAPPPPHKTAVISKAYWFFSDERPESIPAKDSPKNSDGHLLVHVDLSSRELSLIYPLMDKAFVLTAEGQPDVQASAERGYWGSECYLRIPAEQFASMTPGVAYRLAPANPEAEYGWSVEGDIRVVRDAAER